MKLELTEQERSFVADVRRLKWVVVSAHPCSHQDQLQETFAYTVGLSQSFGWPELIGFGLWTVMPQLLNNAVQECLNGGFEPRAGTNLNEVFQRLPARLVRADALVPAYLGRASWFARVCGAETPLRCLQLVWPNEKAIFPDELGCDQETIRLQTPLLRSGVLSQ